jgi:hypothetical protein
VGIADFFLDKNQTQSVLEIPSGNSNTIFVERQGAATVDTAMETEKT